MVIDDFDVERVAVNPPKTDTPLIVDADAMLPFAIAFERLQSIARRDPKVGKATSLVQIQELAPGATLDSAPTRHEFIIEERFGVLRPKGLDHLYRVLRAASYLKPRLVLDLAMPELTGLELQRTLAESAQASERRCGREFAGRTRSG